MKLSKFIEYNFWEIKIIQFIWVEPFHANAKDFKKQKKFAYFFRYTYKILNINNLKAH